MLPKPSIVVSYADTDQSHVGYVYQACNFIYTGLSAKRTDWKVKGMEKLHGQTIGDLSRGCDGSRVEWMREKFGDDFYLEDRPRKHRYIYVTGKNKAIKAAIKYQQEPFPKGESMLEMANRANNGLLKILEEHKKKPIKIAIVSHADVIKAVLAFAMGLHLDNFQRLIVDPASISKINWNKGSFYVDYINQKSHLSEISSKTNAPSGAVLGGGAG
jgi:hypothetical protein